MSFTSNKELNKKRINNLIIFIKSLEIDAIYLNKIINNKLNELNIIDEALIHTSANTTKNYEKLEFLGDAVLRLAASIFIEKDFPNLNVGERSSLRSHLVSDNWLATLGKKINIKETLIVGPKTFRDKSALKTIEGESTEALIGALYTCCKAVEPIENWLSIYWKKESKLILSDPHQRNYKSALQEWSQALSLSIPKYKTIEQCKIHGDLKRFFSTVYLKNEKIGKGWGKSIKDAEKEAAKCALMNIKVKNNKYS